ncbi:unnamed protein product [Urochloa humidicola]
MGKRQREELNVQAKPKDDKGPLTRCSPGPVTSLAKLLPTAAQQRIQEVGLGNLFKLKLEELGYRKICGDLLDKAVVHAASDLIELPMGGVSVWISEKVVQHAFDMPAGSVKVLPKSNDATAEHKRMYNALRFVCKKFPLPKPKPKASTAAGGAQGSTTAGDQDSTAAVEGAQASTAAAGDEEDFGDYDSHPPEKRRNIFTPQRIVNLVKHCEDEEVKQYVDTDMLVRLFIGVAIDTLLKPVQSSYVTPTTLEGVHDLEKLRDIDWPYMVYQGLKAECSAFPEKRVKVKSPYMTCCVALLIVVILDCIEGNDLQVNEAGRMYLYDDDKVKELLKENANDRIKKRRGPMTSKALEAFIFKKWEHTCYAKFVKVPERIEVPKSTEVPERIEVLERDEVIDVECLDIEKEYQEHVKDCNKCVLDFDEFHVFENTYVACFEPFGHMHSEILHLVCHLWSLDWNDKIILSADAASELLGRRNGTALDKELTTEKMENVKQIFIPISEFHSMEGHWSLVVVTTKPEHEHVYILDSEPSRHQSEAAAVIDRLTEHLSSKHGIDISGYPKEVPNVKPQDNDWDSGFHVLLYIKGFENMDIFDINKEKVLMFRKKLSVELRHHKMNRVRPVGPIHVLPKPAGELPKPAGEADASEERDADLPKPAGEADASEQVLPKPAGEADASEERDADLPKTAGEADASEERDAENIANEPNASEDDTGSEKVKGKAAGEEDASEVDALVSPLDKRISRKRAPNSSMIQPLKFEVATQLTANKRVEVYKYVKEHCNDSELFKLGDITMTGVS